MKGGFEFIPAPLGQLGRGGIQLFSWRVCAHATGARVNGNHPHFAEDAFAWICEKDR